MHETFLFRKYKFLHVYLHTINVCMFVILVDYQFRCKPYHTLFYFARNVTGLDHIQGFFRKVGGGNSLNYLTADTYHGTTNALSIYFSNLSSYGVCISL